MWSITFFNILVKTCGVFQLNHWIWLNFISSTFVFHSWLLHNRAYTGGVWTMVLNLSLSFPLSLIVEWGRCYRTKELVNGVCHDVLLLWHVCFLLRPLILCFSFSARKFSRAIELYTQAIELNGQNAVYWANRAFAHIRLEEYGSAIQDATKAIEVDPKYSKVVCFLKLQVCLHLFICNNNLCADYG